MYIQHSKLTRAGSDQVRAVALDEPGPVVRLLSDVNYVVTFVSEKGETASLPSHEFYMSHREATPADTAHFMSGLGDDEPPSAFSPAPRRRRAAAAKA